MNPVRKANILIIILIAIVGLGAGNIAALFTGDYVKEYIHLNAIDFNESSKMATVDDGDFNPTIVNKQPTIVVPNNTAPNSTSPNGTSPNGTSPNGTSPNGTNK
ncbi:MAG: hypothetical protein LBD03_07135 [Methanobrevibacter sp.]|nr:hypothetical protein [Candidatus Methanovirga procula]